MRLTLRLCLLIFPLGTGLCHAESKNQNLAQTRQIFLQAEQSIYQDEDTDYIRLSDSIKSYPLYPYLQYQWLKKHLDYDNVIQAFLEEFPKSRYAGILRQKWLLQLAQNQQWPKFLSQYRHSDDQELLCYHALAQFQTGNRQAGMDKAKQYWISGKTQPAACDGLFSIFSASQEFGADTIWQRFQAAVLQDNIRLATQMQALLPNNLHKDADLWLDLHQQPALVKDSAEWKQHYSKAGLLFAHAIIRWMDNNSAAAVLTWDTEKQNYNIPDEIVADTEKRLALTLAYRQDSRAYDRLAQLGNQDNTTREWRIRSALVQQNWTEVLTAIEALTDDEKNMDKWRYWRARAQFANGETESAKLLFQGIVKNRSFYGYLAAAKMQQNIGLHERPVLVTDSEILQLQDQTEFQVTAELLALDRKAEAKKQWWHAITGLDARGLQVAAKLAQQWQMPAVAIFTIAKANEWDDMELRFPLLYLNQIKATANEQQLDPSIIYGLIRQESAFDEVAESPAGAKGLMQLMPKTAQQIAQELKDKWNNEASLFNPALNIKYGSYYYKKLLQQFNGEYLLAAAAYNAGAGKVKRWLPDNTPLPGDIWIESIPYKETRGYVSSVLFYAMIYQQRLHKTGLNPENLIRDIKTDY
jgi:soluble lytic murein transglycosylase